MSGQDTHRVERKIDQARLAMGWERLWAALHWPIVAVMLTAAVLVSGVLAQLPTELRFGGLAVLAAAVVMSLRPVFRLVWPGRADAMRRVETASGLTHRPVAGHFDRLSASQEDPATSEIWNEHRRRQLAALGHLKAGRPRSSWRDIDPRALRLPAMLALGLGLILGPNDPGANIRDTLRLTPPGAGTTFALDAWLKPPAYTGKPPLLLTSPATQQRLADGSGILTPENAVLAIRLNGATKPGITVFELGANNEAGAPLTSLTADETLRSGLYEAEVKLSRPAVVAVVDGGREIGRWPIALIPDTPPEVSIEGQPGPDASGALGVAWKVADDYGVSGVSADISLSDEQEDGHGIASNGVFLFDPPALPIGLRHGQPRSEEGRTVTDLTAHPWAGLMVELTLEARDAAGHATQSAPRTLKLPERVFIKPLARALVEQRRSLVMSPDYAERAGRLLEGLLIHPDGLIDRSSIHLAMATAVSRLANLRGHDDIKAVVDLLWQTALAVEEGDLADARAELDALREELRRALAEGAPPERIAELMSKLREAMDRYMQSLMEETERRMQQGQLDQQQMPQQQGRTVRPEDLQKMLDMIEKLAQSGANEAAEELLSQLEDILRNLQPGMPQQAQPQRDTPLSRMLDQLSELMRRQQGLMDDTQRLPQPGEGELSPQDGREPGANGQRGTPEGLAEDQQRLEEMLEQMLNQLGQNALQAPPSLGEAGKEMNGATNSLRESDRDQALGQQGRALEQLRQGAENMAQQLLQQGTGNQGNYGRHGEARGDDRDPLGRPLPNRAEDFGPERNMLPSELAMRRAREILDFLRSKANEPEIPRIERDYIDRLLRGLY